MEVLYREGAAAVVLKDGTRAQRGEPVTVSDGVGKRLLAQGWEQPAPPSKSKRTKGRSTQTTGTATSVEPEKEE